MDLTASMRRLYELINAGEIDGFAAALADSFVEHEQAPGLSPNKEGILTFFRAMLAAFPDLQMVPEDVIVSGDKAVARVRMTGTHRATFMGIPPTGKAFDVQLIDITRFGSDGKALEHWGVTDQLGMMQQIGVISTDLPA